MVGTNKIKLPDADTLTPAEEEEILREAARRFGAEWNFNSIEELLTSEDGFGLTTATKLQRAICRIIQGVDLGLLQHEPVVVRALGGSPLPQMSRPPAEIMIICAIRTAKSLIAAATAIWSARHCDVSTLKHGEIPRYSILSVEKDNARVTLNHLIGALQMPKLAPIRVAEKTANRWRELIDLTGSDTLGSEFIWHPSGRPIEIRVVAGKRAGGSLISRWSAGVAFEEAPRMYGAQEGVINYDDAYRAVLARMLPGAQILSIGSPWQPFGPVFDKVQLRFGIPGEDLVVIKATGPAMNPFRYTPEFCEAIRKKDPVAFQTDVLGDFAEVEEALIPAKIIHECIRQRDPKIHDYNDRHEYCATLDPATRGNAWTFVIFDRAGRKHRQCVAKEWQGTPQEPLRPREVLREVYDVLTDYCLTWTYTDQWSADALRDIAEEIGFTLVIEDWTKKSKTDAFLSLAHGMADGQVELLDVPNQEKDMKLVKKRPSTGGVAIVLPQTPDGRHCDYASANARCLVRWLEDIQEAPPLPGTEEFYKKLEEDIEKGLEEKFTKEEEDDDSFETSIGSIPLWMDKDIMAKR